MESSLAYATKFIFSTTEHDSCKWNICGKRANRLSIFELETVKLANKIRNIKHTFPTNLASYQSSRVNRRISDK